jgi:hypothetical protein
MHSRQRGKFLTGTDAREGHRPPAADRDRVEPNRAGNRAERRAAAKIAKPRKGTR